jgi:hypothetical protein
MDGVVRRSGAFRLESTFDYLFINRTGSGYQDWNDPGTSIEVQAGDRIYWHSDGSVQYAGWTLCLTVPTSGPTASPTASPTAPPTASPTDHTTLACVSDDSTAMYNVYSCSSWYSTHPEDCDDSDAGTGFVAAESCCACGGGGTCPEAVAMSGSDDPLAVGTYVVVAGLVQHNRPVYQNPVTEDYLYFHSDVVDGARFGMWLVGDSNSDSDSMVVWKNLATVSYPALCPTLTAPGAWVTHVGSGGWVANEAVTVIAGYGSPVCRNTEGDARGYYNAASSCASLRSYSEWSLLGSSDAVCDREEDEDWHARIMCCACNGGENVLHGFVTRSIGNCEGHRYLETADDCLHAAVDLFSLPVDDYDDSLSDPDMPHGCFHRSSTNEAFFNLNGDQHYNTGVSYASDDVANWLDLVSICRDGSASPSSAPSASPTNSPTTSDPTASPSVSPSTPNPTTMPPTAAPGSSGPTAPPSLSPSQAPATSAPTGSPTSGPTATLTPTQQPPGCTFTVRVRTNVNSGAGTTAAARIKFKIQTRDPRGQWTSWDEFHNGSASTDQWDTASYSTPTMPLRLQLSLAVTTSDSWEIDRITIQGQTIFTGNRVFRTEQGIDGAPNVLGVNLDQTAQDLVRCRSTNTPSASPSTSPTVAAFLIVNSSPVPTVSPSISPTAAIPTMSPTPSPTPSDPTGSPSSPNETASGDPINKASSAGSAWLLPVALSVVALGLILIFVTVWRRQKALEQQDLLAKRNVCMHTSGAFLPGADEDVDSLSGGPLEAKASLPLPDNIYAAVDGNYAPVNYDDSSCLKLDTAPDDTSWDPIRPRRETNWHQTPTEPNTPLEAQEQRHTAWDLPTTAAGTHAESPGALERTKSPEVGTPASLGGGAVLTGVHVYGYQECGDTKASSTLQKPTQGEAAVDYGDVDYEAPGQGMPGYVDPTPTGQPEPDYADPHPTSGAVLTGDHVYEYLECSDTKASSMKPTQGEAAVDYGDVDYESPGQGMPRYVDPTPTGQPEPDYVDPNPSSPTGPTGQPEPDYVDPNPSSPTGPTGQQEPDYVDPNPSSPTGPPEPEYVDPNGASLAMLREDHTYEYQECGDAAKIGSTPLQTSKEQVEPEYADPTAVMLAGDDHTYEYQECGQQRKLPEDEDGYGVVLHGVVGAVNDDGCGGVPPVGPSRIVYGSDADLDKRQGDPEYADCGDATTASDAPRPGSLRHQGGQGLESPKYAEPPAYRPTTCLWESDQDDQQYSTVLHNVDAGADVDHDSTQPMAITGQGRADDRVDAMTSSGPGAEYGFGFVASPLAAEPQYAAAPTTAVSETTGSANDSKYVSVDQQLQARAENGGPKLYAVVDNSGSDVDAVVSHAGDRHDK